MAHLSLQNLTKRFQSVLAVHDLWLEIAAGEIVALLGPSGCGKSTTLQMIAGVLQPNTGLIQLDGRILNQVPPEKRDIALVLQRGLLFPHLTVGENVAFGLKMRGINRVEREQKAIAMLKQVYLDGFGDRKPSELSGGQAQRVALARALVIRPQLLLLDEPLSALDANLREDMQELIIQLQEQTGVTMMLVTHDQSEAVVMSHRIALMVDGRLRQVATPEQIYHQPHDEVAARFMGGVNFFVAQAHGHQWHMQNGLILTSNHAADGSIQATIRPEHIQVFTEPSSDSNTLPATVTQHRFTGTQRRLTLRTVSDLVLYAWVSPTCHVAIDQSVWIRLPPEALWCFPLDAAMPQPATVS
jgi:ABC-type Fe3+/spermidine/putrescine transport system ATPase subunit